MTLQPLETSIVHDKLEQKQIWWQYYYQLYHYQLPPGRKPTVFGPYLLLQTLGEGEFGKVKFGVEVKTGQEVRSINTIKNSESQLTIIIITTMITKTIVTR